MPALRPCCILAALMLGSALPSQAPVPSLPDTAGLAATVRDARRALTRLPATWGIDGRDIAWILTDGKAHAAVRAGGAGDRLEAIELPAGTVIANHSVEWEGRRWAMVRLPLSSDATGRVSLLVHEAMHTFQPEQLPRADRTEAGEGGDFLDGAEGRFWLFLELRALGTALASEGEARRAAARDAIAFRARRDAAAVATERTRLDALDLAEGIPEYTGWKLSGASADSLAALLRRAPTLRVSWVRGVGYWTGPAYGFVLDRVSGDAWRERAKKGERLPDLLAAAVGAASADIAAAASRHGGEGVRRAEDERAAARARQLDSLRTLYVSGPVIRLIPPSLRIAFDPNGQVPLSNAGTVMRGFRWAADDGSELVAERGALVSSSWDFVQVPLGAAALGERTLTERLTVEGDGWRLVLMPGWRVTRAGTRLEVRPPAS